MQKSLLFFLLFHLTIVSYGQLSDDFSDGDFTSSPGWTGTNDFLVNPSKQLQANGVGAKTSYLSTSLSLQSLDNLEWDIYVKQGFSPSSSNYGRVYLAANQSDLTQPLNGYFLQFGEAGSNDAVELFRQTGSSIYSVCRASDGKISASFSIRIKVTRDKSALWKIFIDYSGGTSYTQEASKADNTYSVSSYFGILCTYTASNATKFTYDDIYVGPIQIDTTPPTIQTVQINSSTQIQITFSEALDKTSSEMPANYNVNNGVGSPQTATLQADLKTVLLTFSSPFPNGIQSQLTVSNVQDLNGNAITQTSQSFLFFVPSPVNTKDIVINEFFPDPNPTIGLPAQEFVEIYNRSNNPIDLAGWKLTDGVSTATFPSQIILPKEYWITTATTAAALFTPLGKTLGLTNFPTLNNGGDKIVLIDPGNKKIDTVAYDLNWYNDPDKQEGGWSIEAFNPDATSYDSSNWSASIDPTGGTPGRQNSLFGKKYDTTPPECLAVTVNNPNELNLSFNEKLDPSSVTTLSNYVTVHQQRPVSAALDVSQKSITLTFADSFRNGVRDTLAITGLSDLAQNNITPIKKAFLYFVPSPVSPHDIIINEFMADPTPVVSLPESEFIEIFNRSSNPVDITNWTISDGVTTGKLPSAIVLPNEYWVLSSKNPSSDFSTYGNNLRLSSFPSLNNGGDHIILKNSTGITIDSLSYNLNWYNEPLKKNGGWSIELVNPGIVDSDSSNWHASIDLKGGTPGKQNSWWGKNPDVDPPKVLSVTTSSQNSLLVIFNEKVEPSSAQPANYQADHSLGQPSNAVLSHDQRSVVLTFQNNFENGLKYIITLTGIKDLAGNLAAEIQQPFIYFVPSPVNPKDIIISELMADPTPVVGLPETEYIEIYNRSENPIDLTGWKITDGKSLGKIPAIIILPHQYWILSSATSASDFSTFGNNAKVPSFPSLNNGGDSIVLKNDKNSTIDSVTYSLSWYGSTTKQEGGWSLEIIDPDNTCGAENNWAASEDVSGGTPGRKNSVYANKPDLTGPKLVSAVVKDPTTLKLTFDEILAKSLAAASFILSPEISITEASLMKGLKEIEITLGDTLIRRQLYSVQVNNVTDCNGNAIQADFNLAHFAIPEVADSLNVLVNEVLFNPRPGGFDFVELFNNSPKYINLRNWKFANISGDTLTNKKGISANDLILSPMSYLAFTANPAVLLGQYPQALPENIFKSVLPSMNDDEGSIAVISSNNKVIDAFTYSRKYHSPLINDDEGVSLERISFTESTNDAHNWKSASASSGYATPGYINSNARPDSYVSDNAVIIEPEIFSPQVAGQDFSKINYHFDQSGLVANIKIVDTQGRLMKTLANNETLSYEGFFRWDGDRDDGTQARMGYYVVWFEVFNSEGTVQTYRKRIVLAARN